MELKEKKHRIEDAVQTTKAAVEEGVVPGGGVALLRAQAKVLELAKTLDGDEATGAKLVARALEEPLKQIAVNAGLEGGVIVEKVRSLKGANGLNAATGEYEDLVKAGVIDAAKVTRSALQNAASIAALFLTTEAVVADKPEEKGAGGGAGGGMPTAAWVGWAASSSQPPPNIGRERPLGRLSRVYRQGRVGQGGTGCGDRAGRRPSFVGCGGTSDGSSSGSSRWWPPPRTPPRARAPCERVRQRGHVRGEAVLDTQRGHD